MAESPLRRALAPSIGEPVFQGQTSPVPAWLVDRCTKPLGSALLLQNGNYDLVVHTGDVIGIGPFPAEFLEGLRSLPNALLLMAKQER